MALEKGTKLGSYEILAPIGAGGMGEVYRARDNRLRREVAIKVLPAQVGTDAERLQRFEREATTVAALNHPNIVTIFGIEESNGHRFIAMELVEGETLDRLIAPGGMPLAKIFDIAIPLADALAAAHDKGIVHRDLKPGNVMVTKEGRVKVLDFGLAKLTTSGQGGLSPDDVTMSVPLTGRGTVIGTVPYMSPEQLQGEALDHRTDLFSLGVMLYEMATGQRPFKGRNSATITSSILRDTPRPLQELNSVVPRHLGRIIEHCLEKDPEQRYQSAKDVRNEFRALRKEVDSGSDLSEPLSVVNPASQPPSSTSSTSGIGSAISAPTRRGEFWIGVGVVVAVLIAGFWYTRSDNEPSRSPVRVVRGLDPPAIESLAVLPLVNLSGDPEQEYFSDGMTDALISDLGKISALRVTSRTSSMRHKGTGESLSSIAKILGVDALLEGSVLRIGDRVRITVQLVEAASEGILWSDSYERDVKDIIDLQREVARAVAEQIQLEVTTDESTRLASTRLVDPDAYELYLQARDRIRKRTVEDVRAGLDLLEQSLKIDPDFALAHAGKADGYLSLVSYDVAPKEIMPQAKAAALRALELDDTSAEAHAALGSVYLQYDWDWEAAEREFDRALELKRSLSDAHLGRAKYLVVMGRTDEAMDELTLTYEYDPYSVAYSEDFFLVSFLSRRFDKVREYSRRALGINPDSWLAHKWLGQALAELGEFDEAVAESEESVRIFHDSVTVANLGRVYAAAGLRDKARESLRTLDEMSQISYVCTYRTALIHVGLDEHDQAFEYLAQACEGRSECLPFLNADIRLDPVRDDPRFRDVQECVGLETEPNLTLLSPTRPSRIMLAVLPFQNLSNDAEQEYFSDGMTDEMITTLGRISPADLGVIARTSAMRYKGTGKMIEEIGRELGVSYVVEGGVRRSGDSVRITVQLIQVSDQTQLWGDSYTRELSDIFAIQAEVAEAVARSLSVELLPQHEVARPETPTENSAAYDAYLLGRSYWAKRTPESLYTAIEHFKRAVKLDPNYALAYSGLADSWGVLPWYVSGPYNEINSQALKAAQKALTLDNSLAEAHVSMGAVLADRGALDSAEPHFRKAVALDPNNATAHQWYGVLLCLKGQFDPAEREFERAVTLDPLSAVMRLDYANGMDMARRFDTAILQSKMALDLHPDMFNAAVTLVWAHIGIGEHDAAATHFEEYLRIVGQPLEVINTFRRTYDASGLRDGLLEWVESLDVASDPPGTGPASRAQLYAWCNENDRAFEWLDLALERQDPFVGMVSKYFAFDNLRDDPRYLELLRKINSRKSGLPSSPTTP